MDEEPRSAALKRVLDAYFDAVLENRHTEDDGSQETNDYHVVIGLLEELEETEVDSGELSEIEEEARLEAFDAAPLVTTADECLQALNALPPEERARAIELLRASR